MTGLIYVILIVVWAVVLVPRWLRHHDEDRRHTRSETLARVLSRHSRRSGSDDEIFDQESDDGRSSDEDGRHHRRLSRDTRERRGLRTAPRSKGMSGARRRAWILLGLVATVLVSLVGVGIGALPKIVLIGSSVLAGGYVAAVAIFGRSRSAAAGTRGSKAAGSGTRETAAGTSTSAGVTVDGVRVVEPGEQGWEPQETTLPTYVTKPKASKVPRRIDLTSGWTGADMVARAREQQASPELSDQFDREWGVVAPDQDEQIAGYANGGRANGDEDGHYRRAVNE